MNKKSLLVVVIVGLFIVLPSSITHSSLPNKVDINIFKHDGDGHLLLKNLHLNEILEINFKDKKGRVIPEAFGSLDHIFRDRMTQEKIPMNQDLLVLLDHIQDHFGNGEVDIISGYRSPELNASLRAGGHGVARRSLHMLGLAIDFRMPGVSTREIRNYAASLKAGGVGFYAGSDFVHIDVGPVRYW